MDGTSYYTTSVIKVYLDIQNQLKQERAADAKRNAEGIQVLAVKAPARATETEEEDVAVLPSRNTRGTTGGVVTSPSAAASLSFTDGMALPSDDEDYVAPPVVPEDTLCETAMGATIKTAATGKETAAAVADKTVTMEAI